MNSTISRGPRSAPGIQEGGVIDWIGGLFYKDEKTNIQEHEFEPGYLDFYTAVRRSTARPLHPVFSNIHRTAASARPPTRRHDHLCRWRSDSPKDQTYNRATSKPSTTDLAASAKSPGT